MSELLFKENAKVAIFKAPEGDYRQIVMDHMLRMANIEWTPRESFSIKWKGEARFPVNLEFEKGKTYHGIAYSNTKSSLDEFESYLENGVFEPNSEFYEEIVGNHCSSSIAMAYQQLIDFPFAGSFKPNSKRGVASKMVGNLKIPTVFPGEKWDALDMFQFNSKNDVMEAYASVDMGDMIFFCTKRKSGHIRMVYSKSDVVRFENGQIDPDNSFVHCIEQTNTWCKYAAEKGKRTTWWIDRKYSFARLYEKEFMPCTLSVFTSGEKLKDAYVVYDGTNNAQTIFSGLQGDICSTFPLAYAKATVRDKNGKLVRNALIYNLAECYEIKLSDLNEQLDLQALEKGCYHFTLRAGIARGGKNFEEFEFTV